MSDMSFLNPPAPDLGEFDPDEHHGPHGDVPASSALEVPPVEQHPGQVPEPEPKAAEQPTKGKG